MKTVKLESKTNKGKNKLNEARTSIWEIVRITDNVRFSSLPGPWAMVTPCGQTAFHKSSRWIHLKNDEDFNVLELNETI